MLSSFKLHSPTLKHKIVLKARCVPSTYLRWTGTGPPSAPQNQTKIKLRLLFSPNIYVKQTFTRSCALTVFFTVYLSFVFFALFCTFAFLFSSAMSILSMCLKIIATQCSASGLELSRALLSNNDGFQHRVMPIGLIFPLRE